jgi:hypothetical protein
MGQMILSEPSIILIWTYQDMMEWMSRILVGKMAGADEDFGLEVWWLIFVGIPQLLIQFSKVHMGQIILSEPSIILILTYQDMMEWMSRILVGEMAGADEDFGLEVGQMWLPIFVCFLKLLIQLSKIHIWADDPFRTINYPHLDISGHDGMDEQDIGWKMAGADEDFGLEVGQMWLIFVGIPTASNSSKIHMGQMILSPEPSIILIWTYQDMMEWMSRILV